MNPTWRACLFSIVSMILALVLGLPLVGILGCGLLMGVAGWIWGGREAVVAQPALSRQELRTQLVDESQATLKALQGESQQLPLSMRQSTEAIATTAQNIQRSLQADSLEFNAARRFISEYLKNTLTIVRSYNSLRSKGSQRLAQVEPELGKLLERVREGFEKQKEHLLADDVLRLEVEMKVLQQTMEGEG